MVGPGTPCGNPTDMQFVGQAISLPPVIAGGINATMTIDRSYQNLGPAGFLGGTVSSSFVLPAGCTVNGSSGSPSFSDAVGVLGVGTPIVHQRSFTLNCIQPAATQITVASCVVTGPGQLDLTPVNDCDTDVATFLMDEDGDGWTDRDEAGTPLCGDGRNEDSADDLVVDDGCPGGPAVEGAFSEAQFNIGTDPNDPCGTGDNSADFIGTGMSANKVDISDLASSLAPVRHYGASPEDLAFSPPWDLAPGRGLFTTWINISDLTRMIVVKPWISPYNGTIRWYGGPACS